MIRATFESFRSRALAKPGVAAAYDELLRAGTPYDMRYLKVRNGRVIMLLLDKLEAAGDARYILLLKAWQKIDYKKVGQRIEQVGERLGSGGVVQLDVDY